MKKALFAALVVVFVLGFTAVAFAAPPTVIGANGASAFSYRDIQDSAAKYEGGYAQFNNLAGTGYASNGASYSIDAAAPVMAGFGPHGGYDTASNKCKVCHAVHRAEGAYFLLRADSQDDACDYCHIGGSAHSSKVVYTDNAGGTGTTNGHTIGAQAQIPDSTTSMSTTNVSISTYAADGTTLINATIPVRAYDQAKNAMYRLEPYAHGFAGHPLESGTVTWAKVGPLALRCMNCHQVHNATLQIWKPQSYNVATYGDTAVIGYNLLKRYPSASDMTNVDVGIPTADLVKVPETTLSSFNSPGWADPAGTVATYNYSNTGSGSGSYTENGVTSRFPIWAVNEFGNTGYEAVVNNLTLSIWCADCHNLNIGGTTEVPVELGLRSHAERTHPAPFAHGGQCYSCHQAGVGAVSLFGTIAGANAGSGCSRCHYPSSSYNTFKAGTDFPHSAGADSIKLLGAYSWNTPPADGSSYTPTASVVAAGVTSGNLDAVCIRCHPSTGVHN